MVLVEELDDEDFTAPAAKPTTSKPTESERAVPAGGTKTKLERGFLEKAKEPLYGPEGSSEGTVAPETHKAHMENDMNKKMNKEMNRGAEDNNGHERPPWYTKDWPKDCQYNSPGCALDEMSRSEHKSEHHKSAMRDQQRWEAAAARGQTTLRLSFFGLTDEDVPEVVALLKGNEDVKELDLTHNELNDAGVQALVACLATGAAPNLKELRIYKNNFGDLGKTMLMQGLTVFRKKLEVKAEEPDWARLAGKVEPAPGAVAA